MSETIARLNPILIVFLLDVDQPITLADIQMLLPQSRDALHPLRLSDPEFGAPPVRRSGPEKTPVDWNGLAGAMVRMVVHAKELARNARIQGTPISYYIAGRAPLPLFSLMASELSAWAHHATVLNQRKDGSWVSIPLDASESSSPEPFFDLVPPEVSSASPSEADGRVAVFVSCAQPVDKEAIHAFIRERGERVATIVEIRTSTARDLNQANYASAAKQLDGAFSGLRTSYPRASGFAVFVAGPAHLAMMAGRALNETIFRDVWIGNYDAGHYDFAFSLPWRGNREISIPQGGEDKLARRRVLDAINEGLQAFRQQFREEDLPPQESFPMDDEHRRRFLKAVQELKPLEERDVGNEPFQLACLENLFFVSPGLLHALRGWQPEAVKTFGQTFILHELFHIDQKLRSSYYHGIGRAGFSLEEVDYWADAFALGVLARMSVRDLGSRGVREVVKIVTALTDNVLDGIAAFDRFEHGDRIEVLQERRLRRYLFWHLQHRRAHTLLSPDDIWKLFGKRLFVELAPLYGYLNVNGDKVVNKGDPACTELFIVLEARLMREPRTASLTPADFVELIRSYDKKALQLGMATVVEKHEVILVPWKAR